MVSNEFAAIRFEMYFILIFGAYHIFVPFLNSITFTIQQEFLWFLAPFLFLLGILSVVYILTRERTQQILKWICMFGFAGGSITHLLFLYGIMPSWFETMPLSVALFGIFMDGFMALAIYDYSRRL